MIKYVVASKKNGSTKYRVGYGCKEVRYANKNLPQTVKKFMEKHKYRISENMMIFE